MAAGASCFVLEEQEKAPLVRRGLKRMVIGGDRYDAQQP
jgi:hypothetical protein